MKPADYSIPKENTEHFILHLTDYNKTHYKVQNSLFLSKTESSVVKPKCSI